LADLRIARLLGEHVGRGAPSPPRAADPEFHEDGRADDRGRLLPAIGFGLYGAEGIVDEMSLLKAATEQMLFARHGGFAAIEG
jgi:hypothetical protein